MSKQPADPIVSAQVLLKPASGVRPADAEITARNIAALAPAGDDVDAVVAAFSKAGLEIGAVVGLGFSITGPRSTFDRVFGTQSAGESPGELPLDRLPARVRRGVSAVTFPPPPDFGPGSY